MSFGRWLAVAAVLVGVVAVVERYDERLALMLAFVTLLAVLFHNRTALADISKLLASTTPLPPHERT